MIPQRTKDALRAAKTRGVISGNAKQAEANPNDADVFAESLRPIVAPFIHLSSRRIAKVLNDRAASNRQPARRGNLSPCCAWWNA
jgi:hypothetical protein